MNKEQGQKIAIASAVSLIAEPAMQLAHFGGPGVIAGLAAGAAAYLIADEVQQSRLQGEGGNLPSPVSVERKGPSLAKRLLTGKSMREASQPGDSGVDTTRLAQLRAMPYDEYLKTPEWQARRARTLVRDQHTCQDCGVTKRLEVHHLTYERLGCERDEDLLTFCRDCHQARHTPAEPMEELQPSRPQSGPDDTLMAPRRKRSGMFLFSQVLETFTPTLDRIYLGTLETGELVFCRAEELCHVALAGTTRGGKSSIMRLLTAQLCYAGASVLILNPHHSRYLYEKREDWTPFEACRQDGTPYLLYPPMECRQYDVIEHYLRQVVEIKMAERRERVANGRPAGKPFFLVLDELPDIVKHVSGASGYLDDLVRQGAKYNLFVVSASQDFLVKTLKLESGEARECYRTAYYVGGGAQTAKILLDGPVSAEIENTLGAGTVMLRNWKSANPARVAFVPYVDNESLYRLLGPSTYTPAREPQVEDDLTSYVESGNGERDTDPVVSTRYTSGQRALRSADERRHAREQRLRGGQVAAARERVQEVAPAGDNELARGIDVYQRGAKTIDDFQAAMGLQTQHQARALRARVKMALREDG